MSFDLPLCQNEDQYEFWKKLRPVNLVAATDTYKRTMSSSSSTFVKNCCYNLAARRAIREHGVKGRYIMAGLERAIYPWFIDPVSVKERQKACDFFSNRSKVKKIHSSWMDRAVIPLTIWSLPGGQTFLAKDGKYVPMMSVEGPGIYASHIEPHLEQIYPQIIQATKARLMREVAGSQFVEFGLRSDRSVNDHVILMLAISVGGGFRGTSNDQAVYLYPELFDDVGTIGHEFIMSYQRPGMSLREAQQLAFREFVEDNHTSALLPDVIDTITAGLPDILECVRFNPGKLVMPRMDSGDINAQCVHWKHMTLAAGFSSTKIVVEDGYNPEKARETKENYALAGFDPEEIIIGAGGYFQEDVTRDSASVVFKRSATLHDDVYSPSMKFSNSPGKASIPGRVRIYGRDDTLIVAQEGEPIKGEFLMQKVVDNGRINYWETIEEQQKRTSETWEQYKNIEYSPWTEKMINDRLNERNMT